MKQLLVLSIICTVSVFKTNAQKLETKWIQEFDSKMEIIDVPLIEEDYVFLALKKGGDEYDIKNIFLQKRKIVDNSLVKEIEFITSGELMDLSDFYQINSEVYCIVNSFFKKEKKNKVIIYKLNKEKVEFEQYKTILEITLKNEKLHIHESINYIDNKEYVTLFFSKINTKRYTFVNHEGPGFIISEKGVEEVDYKTILSYQIKNNFNESTDNGFNKNLEKYGVMIKNKGKEYFTRSQVGIKLFNNTYNAYSLIRDSEDKVSLINYDMNVINEVDAYGKNYSTITNGVINTEFNFNPDGNDYLSINKQDSDIFILMIKYNTTKGHSTLTNGTDPVFTSYSDIEIVKVDKNKKFCWKKSIDCESHAIGKNKIYYLLKYKNNVVLFYYNKYLLINIKTGEYKIEDNNDFSLEKKYKLKWQPPYKKSIVYTSNEKQEKRIGIIQFVD